MAIVETIIGFLVSLFVGAFGIYVGARAITGIDDYNYAIITALIGSVVWWLIAALASVFTWIPIIGGFFGVVASIIALIVWITIVNWRYPGGYGNAIMIGLIAWVAAWVVMLILSFAGIVTPDALGVPRI